MKQGLLPYGVEVVAAADIVASHARGTAEAHGIPYWTDDPQRMLDTQDLDIVSVCAPNSYHKPWTLAALKAGAVRYTDAQGAEHLVFVSGGSVCLRGSVR